jgi:predicted phage tail protein
MIKLSWTNPSDPDFSHVDIVEYKGAAQPSDPSEGTLVASINSTSLTRAGLEEAMTYWYWIRSVDTSGNVSAWLGPVSGVTQMTVIDTINIADLAITETKIANDSISAPKLKANSVDANKITAGAVTTEKIATNAITTDRIAANAVTADKINVNMLSAIAADLGTVTAGVAKSADGKFEIDLVNRTLKVFDDQGRLRVQLGKLS